MDLPFPDTLRPEKVSGNGLNIIIKEITIIRLIKQVRQTYKQTDTFWMYAYTSSPLPILVASRAVLGDGETFLSHF